MLKRFVGERVLPRSISLVALSLLVFIGATSAAESAAEGKLRVLVITGGHAYEEGPFVAMFNSIPDIEAKHVVYPQAAELLKPELAQDADVIVFYDMWAQGISPAQQQAFVALLNQGIGVVALHHTLAAHADWPEYQKLIGGRFYIKERQVNGKTLPTSGYDHDQDIEVKVAAAEHPITRGLKDFTIHDETYSGYDTDSNARVLLTTEHPKSDRELAWVTQYGASRVFTLQLGHDHFAYEHPTYRQLIARGIRWTAGRPADPQAPVTRLFNGRDLSGWKTEGEPAGASKTVCSSDGRERMERPANCSPSRRTTTSS